MTNSQLHLDLQSASNQINLWRRTRKSSSETMPDHLKNLIAKLVPLHSIRIAIESTGNFF